MTALMRSSKSTLASSVLSPKQTIVEEVDDDAATKINVELDAKAQRGGMRVNGVGLKKLFHRRKATTGETPALGGEQRRERHSEDTLVGHRETFASAPPASVVSPKSRPIDMFSTLPRRRPDGAPSPSRRDQRTQQMGRSVSDTNNRIWGPPPARTGDRSLSGEYNEEGEEDDEETVPLFKSDKGVEWTPLRSLPRRPTRESSLYALGSNASSSSTSVSSSPLLSSSLPSHARSPTHNASGKKTLPKHARSRSHFIESNRSSSISGASGGNRLGADPFAVSTITSTARARPRGPQPSADELNRRSSQFIGQWCPTPSMQASASNGDLLSESRSQSLGLHPRWPSEPVSKKTPAQLQTADEEESEAMEQLEDLLESAKGAVALSEAKEGPLSSTTGAAEQAGDVWAVGRGWRRGVYTLKSDAEAQTRGFPGPVIRRFDTASQASEWLELQTEQAKRIPSLRTLNIDEDDEEAPKGLHKPRLSSGPPSVWPKDDFHFSSPAIHA